MFDFDIEQVISFTAFMKITRLDGTNEAQCREFIQQQTLFSMSLSTPEKNQPWLEGAQEFLQRI